MFPPTALRQKLQIDDDIRPDSNFLQHLEQAEAIDEDDAPSFALGPDGIA